MTDSLEEHLKAISDWIAYYGQGIKDNTGISSEEKKQLAAVNKSIEQLTRLNVSIPEDLRALKLRLSARDNSSLRTLATRADEKDLDSLIEKLKLCLQGAKHLRARISSDRKSSGARKVFGVTVEDLLSAGLISTEDKLELQWVKTGPLFEGKIGSDGHVVVKTSKGWEKFKSLSAAAESVGGRALNGWAHWRVVREGGRRVAMEEIRQSFIHGEQNAK